MYYFNAKLVAELPKIMGIPHTRLSEMAGFSINRICRWANNPNMPVYDFVQFLNRFRLSMADFLITREEVPVAHKKELYVTPIEIWEPIEWDPAKLIQVLKRGNNANVTTKAGLAKELGNLAFETVSRWMSNEKTMKMKSLLDILNRLHLDAKELITDHNKVIGVPQWECRSSKNVERLNQALGRTEDLERKLKEAHQLIADLNVRNKELKKENDALKSLVNSGVAAEPSPWRKKGYVFHIDLWHSLPGLFNMTKKNFCQMVGMHDTAFMRDSVDVTALVNACNNLRISVSHFFPREGQVKVVQSKSYYEISKNAFQPIEDRTRDLQMILTNRLFGIKKMELSKVVGLKPETLRNFSEGYGYSRKVSTLVDICNKMGISIGVFLLDLNETKRLQSYSALNETMALNCIEMFKELQRLKGK